jgi:hypothetical protein
MPETWRGGEPPDTKEIVGENIYGRTHKRFTDATALRFINRYFLRRSAAEERQYLAAGDKDGAEAVRLRDERFRDLARRAVVSEEDWAEFSDWIGNALRRNSEKWRAAKNRREQNIIAREAASLESFRDYIEAKLQRKKAA